MPNRRRIPRVFFLPNVGLLLVMGLAYLFGGAQRTSSPSFAFAKTIAPMHVWGIVFLAGALAVGLALASRSSRALAGSLYVGGGIFTWWACCFAVAAVQDPEASLTGWAVHGFIAATMFLSGLEAQIGHVA